MLKSVRRRNKQTKRTTTRRHGTQKMSAVFAIYNRRRFFTLLKMIETNKLNNRNTVFP